MAQEDLPENEEPNHEENFPENEVHANGMLENGILENEMLENEVLANTLANEALEIQNAYKKEHKEERNKENRKILVCFTAYLILIIGGVIAMNPVYYSTVILGVVVFIIVSFLKAFY